MKKHIILSALLLTISLANAQTIESVKTEERSLRSFNKIIVSPKINIILQKGEKESIRLVCNNVSPEQVNVVVKWNRLHIYLDDARITEKQIRTYRNGNHQRMGIYKDASVTAYVTYTQLKVLEMRGEGEASCDSKISSKRFKLRAYGECEINLASVKTMKFKTSLYGENKVTIRTGSAERQVYRLFGENKIDTRGLSSAIATARIYGEGRLSLNASDEVHYSAVGEPIIAVSGNPVISRGIVIGSVSLKSINP